MRKKEKKQFEEAMNEIKKVMEEGCEISIKSGKGMPTEIIANGPTLTIMVQLEILKRNLIRGLEVSPYDLFMYSLIAEQIQEETIQESNNKIKREKNDEK